METQTHIEHYRRNPQATRGRVITGAGIYSVEPDSAVEQALNDTASIWRTTRILVYLEEREDSVYMVGMSSRDHTESVGHATG